jgi:transcriptional regulator GlxA family with amidase domain
MAMRRVVVVAMPCTEVVDVAGILDIFYAVNERTDRTGAFDAGYAVEVVSPVETVTTWPGLRLVADRSYRAVRGSIDTVIVTGIDEPDDAKRDPELVRCRSPAVAWASGAGVPDGDGVRASSRPVGLSHADPVG